MSTSRPYIPEQESADSNPLPWIRLPWIRVYRGGGVVVLLSLAAAASCKFSQESRRYSSLCPYELGGGGLFRSPWRLLSINVFVHRPHDDQESNYRCRRLCFPALITFCCCCCYCRRHCKQLIEEESWIEKYLMLRGHDDNTTYFATLHVMDDSSRQGLQQQQGQKGSDSKRQQLYCCHVALDYFLAGTRAFCSPLL
jgi:hypothetical protein